MSDDYGFWPRANQALTAARAELDSNDDARLPYAALHLRMAMEALIYERSHTLRELLPPEQIEAWQPRKVLNALLEVEPGADQGAMLWMGIEDTPGVESQNMQFMGGEHVLSRKTIKQYDALGAHLHLPTLKQFREGTVLNNESLRRRCEEIAAEVRKALFSPLRNLVAGRPVDFECRKCGSEVKRRLPLKAFDVRIVCNCKAEYRAVGEAGKEIRFYPLTTNFPCPAGDCDQEKLFWQHEIEAGTEWECEKCHRQYALGLGAFEKVTPAESAE